MAQLYTKPPESVEEKEATPATLALWEAIRLKDMNGLEKALKEGADVEAFDHYQLNALAICILNQNEQAFSLLLEKCNLNSKVGRYGQTILTFALSRNLRRHFAVLLIEKGADVLLAGTNLITPLMAAIQFSSAYSNQADALSSQDWFLIQKIVEKAPHKINENYFQPQELNRTAISIALQKYQKHDFLMPKVITLLLKNGAKLDRDVTLREACEKGYSSLVHVLLEAGGTIHSSNIRGQTPLAIAAANGFQDICQMLIVHGSQVNCVDLDGYTPLMEAAIHGKQDCVSLLLENGAIDPPYPDAHKTAISMAEENGFWDIANYIRTFLEKKKLMFHIPESHQTPSHKRL